MVPMHVIVVGCGRVGSELAAELEAQGHTVAVIDKNRNAFRRLPERFTGRAVLGFGFDRDQLDQAGSWAGRKLTELDERDLFRLVAVTREGQSRLATPELVGQEGDIVYMAVRRDARDDLHRRLAEEGRRA